MSLFMLTFYGMAASAVYHLFPARVRWVILLLASYGFYAARGAMGLPFILLTTLSTWLAALWIGKIAAASKAFLQENKASLSKEEKQ